MAVVDTKKFLKKGIQRILVPFSADDLSNQPDSGVSLIQHFLPKCIGEHNTNKAKEKYFYDFYKGTQDIASKERQYKGDANNNNRVVENHAFAQVNFKVGFLLGDRRRFTKRNAEKSDDITYLDMQLSDCRFFAKDKELKTWIYSTGIGVTINQPRTDIIDGNGRYVEWFDKDTMACFTDEVLNPMENFVVYSQKANEPVFCVSISTRIDFSDRDFRSIEVYQVWTRDIYFELDTSCTLISEVIPQAIKMLPMVEHSINEARIGLVELNRDNFNAINYIVSTCLDASIDGANNVLVFQNVEIDENAIPEMKKSGAIMVSSDPDSGKEGKVYTITVAYNFETIGAFYQQRITKCYDIAGVPLASQDSINGGDTARARTLGGGWQNAYSIVKGEILSLIRSDYEQLKLILEICKTVEGNKVNELRLNDVEIKYSINPNDNVLAKAQAASDLYSTNMPKKMILQATGISLDPETDGRSWEEEDKKKRNVEDSTDNTDENISVREDDKTQNVREDDKTQGDNLTDV